MEGIVPGLVAALKDSGPAGALVAAGIIGLALAIILFAHFKGLWADTRSGAQVVGFQDRLLALVDKLSASEDALRRRIDELAHDKENLRDEVEELRVALALLRNQRRRLIDMLRQPRPQATPARQGAA